MLGVSLVLLREGICRIFCCCFRRDDFVSVWSGIVSLQKTRCVPRDRSIQSVQLGFRFVSIFGYSYQKNSGKSNFTGVRAQLILVQGPGEDTSDEVGQRRKIATGQGRGKRIRTHQIRDTYNRSQVHIISASSSTRPDLKKLFANEFNQFFLSLVCV